MTDTLPAWSPLNDPQLSAQIDAGLDAAHEFERLAAQRDRYFLERYPWQEFPVKCGRWRVSDASSFTITGGSRTSGPWTKKEWTPDFSWILVLDPASRQPIAAHCVKWWNEAVPSERSRLPVSSSTSSLWLAGDPRACGMFTPVGHGHRAAFGYRVGKGGLEDWDQGPARFEKALPLLTAQPYVEKASHEFGPWIADHPQQPRRPRRFSRAAWSNF